MANADVPGGIDGISVLPALSGKNQEKTHEFLYWDYGHCRNRYDQAVHMGRWKGIREGKNSDLQLYNLEIDIAEENDVAEMNPEIVRKINKIMKEAYIPDERYPIGDIYRGEPIWKKETFQNY